MTNKKKSLNKSLKKVDSKRYIFESFFGNPAEM